MESRFDISANWKYDLISRLVKATDDNEDNVKTMLRNTPDVELLGIIYMLILEISGSRRRLETLETLEDHITEISIFLKTGRFSEY